MFVLQALVLLTIIVVAGFVGYHVWQDWLHESDVKAHHIVISTTLTDGSFAALALPQALYSGT